MASISILGLGIIGSRIARHLANQGVDVTVWNRTPKDGFAKTASTPLEAAQANKIISLYLKDKDACKEVFAAMKPALTPEHIILNHSTIDLQTVRELAEECDSIGCGYLDCPFTGSKGAAEGGQLAYYVSGNNEILDKVRPLLEKSSKAVIETGKLGNGTILKLVTNLLSATMVQGLCEALSITKAHGIGATQLLEAVSVNVTSSPLASFKVPCMDQRNFETNFSLDNMRKDSVYAIELAQEKGITPPMISLVSSLMSGLCNDGYAEKDFCCLIEQKNLAGK